MSLQPDGRYSDGGGGKVGQTHVGRNRTVRHGFSSINKLDRGASYFFVAPFRQRALSRGARRGYYLRSVRGGDLLWN